MKAETDVSRSSPHARNDSISDVGFGIADLSLKKL